MRCRTRGEAGVMGGASRPEPMGGEGLLQARPPVGSFEFAGRKDTEPAVDRIQIEGPYNAVAPEDSTSRRNIFICHPTGSRDEEPCARRILAALARRAYRRPVTEADVQKLLRFYT